MMHSHLRENLGTFAELSVPFAVYTAKNNDHEEAKPSTTGEEKAGEKSSTAPPSNPAKKE
jgi:hypothetical protein